MFSVDGSWVIPRCSLKSVFQSDGQKLLVVVILWGLIHWYRLLLLRCFSWLNLSLHISDETNSRLEYLSLETSMDPCPRIWNKEVSTWHLLIVHYFASWLLLIDLTSNKNILTVFELGFISRPWYIFYRDARNIWRSSGLELTNDTRKKIDYYNSSGHML